MSLYVYDNYTRMMMLDLCLEEHVGRFLYRAYKLSNNVT